MFQSTRPARGATCVGRSIHSLRVFQSTRPARGATSKILNKSPLSRVSIHAPRAGRDIAV